MKNDGHLTNRIMKSGNFVKVVESDASAEKWKRVDTGFVNKEGIKNFVHMQEDKGWAPMYAINIVSTETNARRPRVGTRRIML
jgi:hypothetical protein